MKNSIKLLLVCLACLAANCKYEDGPFLSFRSLINRIEGDYYIKSLTVNGQDQLYTIIDLKIEEYRFSWVEDDFFGYSEYGDLAIRVYDTFNFFQTRWSLESNNNEIEFTPVGCFQGATPVQSYPLPGFLNNGTCEPFYWKIKRLTNKDLWLAISFDDDDYEVHLKEE